MDEAELITRFGITVRQLRLKAGYSQEEFADLCGLHRTYIGTIERGEKRVTIATAYKLAKALGLPLSDLFKHIEESSNQ
ncbi:MAG: transcriptional regulator [Chloroflexota bacterium]|nr:MAG: transcriptional regulator [Chloroflexota bacterium]